MLTLSRSKSFLSVVLFTCVLLVLSSAAVFASEETPLSSEVSLVIPDEYNDPVYEKLASGTRAVDPGTTYTIDDIYRVLNNNIRIGLTGENADSSYSLPRIASYLHWLRTSMATAGGGSVLDNFDDNLAFLPSIYSSSQQIHGDLQNNSYYLSQINSHLSGSIDWVNSNSTWVGASLDPSGSNISAQDSKKFFGKFTLSSSIPTNTPCLVRVFLPFYRFDASAFGLQNYTLASVYSSTLGGFLDIPDYFIEPCQYGIYLYLFDTHTYPDWNYSFEIQLDKDMYYNSSYSGRIDYLVVDLDSYQQIKQAFYQRQTANSVVSVSESVSSLANYLVSPEKQAAENASQAVIDDTLDGFTGNGSAAAKTSDTGSMKNMSGSIQNGLNSGASASNAASVFSNQTFWSWFTKATSDGINSPYPAPVVNLNSRLLSYGDSVPDFLSGNQAELNDLLNQRDSW